MIESEPIAFIVDDDDSVRKSLARLLRSEGIAVESFVSAEAFLARAQYAGPRCLILDVRMSGLSGLDLQEELAKSNISIPIIFITGYGTVPMAVRAMKAGAVDILEKPFEDQALLDLVHHAFERDIRTRQASIEKCQLFGCYQSLTPREREVFSYVVSGKLNKQIAYKLGVSEKTVKVHRGRVMEKMQVESLAELVRVSGKLPIPEIQTV